MQHVQDQPRGVLSYIFALKNQLFKEIPLIQHFLNFHQKNEIAFNFTKEIPIKMNRTKKKRFTKKFKSPSILQKKSLKNCVIQFYKRNPFKISSFFIKGVNFTKEIPLNFSRKKITPEIWSQKYPFGPASWRSFLKKVTQVVKF